MDCHAAIARWKDGTRGGVALAGNPNVGKSSLFTQLTGVGVETANYPGKTVEVNLARTRVNGGLVGVLDLPGTYALGAASEDQWVARRALLEARPDVVIAVVDATRLERNLFLPLQLLDLGLPVVVALNLVDEAWREGLRVDDARLAGLLGVPVVPTVAVRGQGVDTLMRVALAGRAAPARRRAPRYGRDVEAAITALAARIEEDGLTPPWGLSPRAAAVLLLEEDDELAAWAAAQPAPSQLFEHARAVAAAIAEAHGEPAALRIARERHGLAGEIGAAVTRRVAAPSPWRERFWRLATAPATGWPLLVGVLAAAFAAFFWIGDRLATLLGGLWEAAASPLIRAGVAAVLGEGVAGRVALWAVDGGINATLSVGIPYVLTFYLMLALLEDTGYLNAVAFLTDPVMHRFGLHGRAVIPLITGAGCNVPAIMGTRVLTTPRERLVASTLVCLTPCSARTAVVAGAVGHYVGWTAALLLFAIVAVLGVGTGVALDRLLPGRPVGLVMEMFPFRAPCWRALLRRTWSRFDGFVRVAFPVVLGGSLLLGVLYETGLVWALAAPMAPVVEGWLGLPAVAGLTLLFAVLRKELALQLLLTLAVVRYGGGTREITQFMDAGQIFVYALVNTLYVPCAATVAVLARELGWRRALGVSALTVALAVLAGGIARRLFFW